LLGDVPTGVLAIDPVAQRVLYGNQAAAGLLGGAEADSTVWHGKELRELLYAPEETEALVHALDAGLRTGHAVFKGGGTTPCTVLYQAMTCKCALPAISSGEGTSLPRLSNVWLLTLWKTELTPFTTEGKGDFSLADTGSGAAANPLATIHQAALRLLAPPSSAPPAADGAQTVQDATLVSAAARSLLLACTSISASLSQRHSASTTEAILEMHATHLNTLRHALRTQMENAILLGERAVDGDGGAAEQQQHILRGVATLVVDIATTTIDLRRGTHVAKFAACDFSTILRDVTSMCRGVAGPSVASAPVSSGLVHVQTDPNVLAVLLVSLVRLGRADGGPGRGITIAVERVTNAELPDLRISVSCTTARPFDNLDFSTSQHGASEDDSDAGLWMGTTRLSAVVAANTLKTLHGVMDNHPFEVSNDGRTASVVLPLADRGGDALASSSLAEAPRLVTASVGMRRSHSMPSGLGNATSMQSAAAASASIEYSLCLSGTMRVLIVDDSPMARQMTCLLFQVLAQQQPTDRPALLRCSLTTAISGEAALRLCNRTEFDFVFMDENFSARACDSVRESLAGAGVQSPESIRLDGLSAAAAPESSPLDRRAMSKQPARPLLLLGTDRRTNLVARAQFFEREASGLDVLPGDGVLAGSEAVREIRKSKAHSNPIIVSMSAAAEARDVSAHLSAGADMVLPKPSKADEFERILTSKLGALVRAGRCVLKNGTVLKGNKILGHAISNSKAER